MFENVQYSYSYSPSITVLVLAIKLFAVLILVLVLILAIKFLRDKVLVLAIGYSYPTLKIFNLIQPERGPIGPRARTTSCKKFNPCVTAL